jgi:hypothetical protein
VRGRGKEGQKDTTMNFYDNEYATSLNASPCFETSVYYLKSRIWCGLNEEEEAMSG